MRAESITFASDGLILEGVFLPPERSPATLGFIICHPHPRYGGDMQNNVVRALAEAFGALGSAVMRFNFRGVGKSAGHYGEGLGEQEDAKAALAWMAAYAGMKEARLWLVGYSFGARIALTVAATDPRVYGFIAVAPPVLRGELPPLTSFPGPKIFIAGEADAHVPPEILASWVDRLPEPKRLIILPEADHFFLGHERTLGQQVVTLLQEYC